MRFIKQRENRLDELDARIIGIVHQEGEISAAKLRKYDDLTELPAPTFYDRLHSLANGGYLIMQHDRQLIVLRSIAETG